MTHPLLRIIAEWRQGWRRDVEPLHPDRQSSAPGWTPFDLKRYDEAASAAREDLADQIIGWLDADQEARAKMTQNPGRPCRICYARTTEDGLCRACQLADAAELVTAEYLTPERREELRGALEKLAEATARFRYDALGAIMYGSQGATLATNSEKGARALYFSDPDEPELVEQSLTDLLANLMHFARDRGIGWDWVHAKAADHFEAEVAGHE